MIATRILFAAGVGILFAAAGVAAAGNFASDSQVDFFTAGTHRFFVWCPGAGDYSETSKGANAEEAQLALYRAIGAEGKTGCWPVWQARVPAN